MSGGSVFARRTTGALLFAALYPTVAAWVYFVVFPGGWQLRLLYTAAKLVQFSFPLLWAWRAGRFPAPPGGRREGVGPGLASGAGLGILLGGAYLVARDGALVAHAAPRIAARVEAIGVGTPLRFLLLALFLSLAHSFLEEYYWRGFLHGLLRERMAAGASTLLSSAAFMSHHAIVLYVFLGLGEFAAATVLLSLGVAAVGAGWAWLYERGGSLASPWLSHLLVDVTVMMIGYDLVWGLG